MNKFEPLQANDVVSMAKRTALIVDDTTFKVEQLIEQLIDYAGASNGKENWFSDGADCEVMQVNKGQWQKGKIRISIQFCPESPDSDPELDRLRQSL